jgi:protein subunit release factor B
MLIVRAVSKLQLCDRSTWRGIATTAILAAKQLPPRPKIIEADIEEKFVKGSGPGGQVIVSIFAGFCLL